MAVTNVLRFPSGDPENGPLNGPSKVLTPEVTVESPRSASGLFSGAIWVVWFFVSLIWPVLRWLLSLDVVYQAARMLWFWDAPGTNAGWVFLGHFFGLVLATCFVSMGGARRPKK